MKKLIILLVITFFTSKICFAQCVNDTLSKNIDRGKYLRTISGNLYETLPGEYIEAMLWLPISSLTICGPKYFNYKGIRYEIFKIMNTDDGESVEAFLKSGSRTNAASAGNCYEAKIIKPAPFMGNNGEIFVLSDGSVWEVKYEYEYMYAYYPNVIACPDRGHVIVDSKKLNALLIKKK